MRPPWLLRPFFPRDAQIDAREIRVLLLVSIAMFFENYDIGLINSALPQITRELGIDADTSGFYLGVIRLGGLGTFLLIPFADRIGRRRVFLLSLVGMSVGTLATGLTQTPLQFALMQMLTRVFMLTGAAVAIVILVEEFPARHRAAGISCLFVLGGLGFGLGAALYAAVEVVPYGWRFLYAVGIVPVAMVPFFRREIAETQRFQSYSDAQVAEATPTTWRELTEPMIELLRTHPRRVLAVGSAGLFGGMGGIAVFQYMSYFLQNVHGWTPGQFTLLVLGGGALGMVGNVLGGRGSDRLGRKRVGVSCLAVVPVATILFYFGPTAALVPAFALYVFCSAAADIVGRALAAELFPTSQRGTASGWLTLVQTLGWASGLFLVGLFTTSIADLPHAIAGVSLLMLLAGAALLFVPETHQRELESISVEPAASRPEAGAQRAEGERSPSS